MTRREMLASDLSSRVIAPWFLRLCLVGFVLWPPPSIGWCADLDPNDWPSWRGPRGDGSWRPPNLPEKWAAGGLREVWSQPIGAAYSGVSVARGRVYTMDRASNRERVLCFDRSSGKPIWTHAYQADYGKLEYGKGPRSTPTIHDGRVFTFGAVGHVHCLDAVSGKVLWSKDLVAEAQAQQPTWGFAASPVIHKGLVIIHAGLRPNGCFVAFDQRTGKEIWRGGKDVAGYGTPIILPGDQPRLVGWAPNQVVCLSLEDGREYWNVPYKVSMGVSIATPIATKDLVVVCGYWEGSKAIRLLDDPRQANLAWEENRFLRGLMSQPLQRDGHAYLLDRSHGLVCFELQTGKKVWADGNRLTPRGRNPQATLVWVGDTDRALVLNSDGELVQARLTPKGYVELARTKVIGKTWAHPAFSGRFLIARDDERIRCLDLLSTE